MKVQWSLFFSLVFALLVAIFAILNVEAVTVRYGFGTVQVSLVLVILLSALFGGVIVGFYGIFRQYALQRDIRHLKNTIGELEKERDKLKESLYAFSSKDEEVSPSDGHAPWAASSAEHPKTNEKKVHSAESAFSSSGSDASDKPS